MGHHPLRNNISCTTEKFTGFVDKSAVALSRRMCEREEGAGGGEGGGSFTA